MDVDMNKYFSYCGLYCGACPYLVATEIGTTAELAKKYNKPEADVICSGCQSAGHEDCEFHTCEKAKSLESCAECCDFPCGKVTALNNDEWEHHSEVISNLTRIKQIGKTAWLQEQQEKWKCQKCGERTQWYQTECHKCFETL
jgi:hypothetical protein